MFYRVLHLLCLLAWSGFLSGQSGNYKIIPPQYELERIKLNTGGSIFFNDIAEDREGYIWLASTAGLHVFDGRNLITYNSGSITFPLSRQPLTNVIGQLMTDPEGRIWMVDGQYVFLFDPVARTVVDSFTSGNSPPAYFRFGSCSNGKLFYAESNRGEKNISLYQKEKGQNPRKIFSIPFTSINNFQYTGTGNYHWFFKDDEIIRVSADGTGIKHYPQTEEGPFYIYGNDSTIYFSGIKQNAVYWCNPATDRIELYTPLPENIAGKIQAIYVDGSMICIASNLNLFILDKLTRTVQDLSPQFSALVQKEAPSHLSEALTRIFRQREQGLLLETQSNLYHLKKKMPAASRFAEIVYTGNPESFTKPVSFRAMTEGDDHSIYTSYYTGLSKKTYGTSGFKPLPVKQYMKGVLVSTYSLQYWNKHLLWNNVLIDMASGSYRYMFDSLFSGHCTQYLYRDSCWLFRWGTNMLHCYDLVHGTLSSYPLGIDISSSHEGGMVIDMNDIVAGTDESNLWTGSHDFGLCLISKKGTLLKKYGKAELGTTDNNVTDIEKTGNQLWFGSTDGLGVLDVTTGRAIVYKNPFITNGLLQNRAVFTIVPDRQGNFYLGSSYGLLYFNTGTRTFFNLPEGHPLATAEFNRASVLTASDGRYYFGTTNGLFSFTPEDLEFINASEPVKPLKLAGIAIFSNRTSTYRYVSSNLDNPGTFVLQPDDNNVQFSFSVPEFGHDVYYSYRISGFSDNWSAYKPDNKIVISGLRPGSYVLEVKVSTSLNDADASYYSLTVRMKQVWYKKTWVIALLMATLLTGVFLVIRNRFNQRLQRQKELAKLRTKISSDLHDDVGSILSGLAMQSQMLAYTASGEQKKSLDETSEMSREAMEHMRDTVWAMDSRKDKYENLIDRMRSFAERNLAMKNFTQEFIISDIDTQKFIDPEKRQAIYLIFKEAITNIIKHSDGNHVKMKFGYEKGSLSLSIHDNGKAHTAPNSDGLGVSNMKMRAGKIGGRLETSNHNGFEVILTIS